MRGLKKMWRPGILWPVNLSLGDTDGKQQVSNMPGQPAQAPIAMDGRMLHRKTTGVGTYARALQQALTLVAGEPSIMIDHRSHEADVSQSPRLMRWLRAALTRHGHAEWLSRSEFLVSDIFRLSQIWFDIHRRLLPVHVPGPAGIMHWTYPVPLKLVGWKNLYTIHDLIPLTHRMLTSIDSHRHRRLLECITREAASIVTVSDASRDEIIALLGCSPARVINCGQAVSAVPQTGPLPAALVPGRYLLVTGSVESRKNIQTICSAYSSSGATIPLVVAGPDGWDAAGLMPFLDQPGIVRLPYMPDEVIQALLANARALVMPSLAEGFGLPVAEAMALGTPVITSDRGALRETAGDAALLVDPDDEVAISMAIRRIVEDNALCTALSTAGRHNAQRFDLHNFAANLAKLHQQLARRGVTHQSPIV
jgi:glycosyltransferase involved in cell wall biosynthesis